MFVKDEWRELIKSVTSFRWEKILHRKPHRLVVRATHLETHKLVVVKCLYLKQNPGFVREWLLASRLKLPHTLPVERYSLSSSEFGLLVFPFVEKNSHHCYPQSRHCYPQSWQTWLRVLKQLFFTLSVLHDQKYAHLDIKPSNILLTESGKHLKIFLIDFGLVESEDFDSEPMGWAGTLPYVDPLFIKSGLVSTKADLWSVGVMLASSIFNKAAHFFSHPFSESSTLTEAQLLPFKLQTAISDDRLHQPRIFHSSLAQLLTHLLVLNLDDRLSAKDAYLKVCEIMRVERVRSFS